MVSSVLKFGMDHINSIKVKDLWVLLRYHLRLERLDGSSKKVKLVEAVTDFFRRDCKVLIKRVERGYVVTNEMGERCRFLV